MGELIITEEEKKLIKLLYEQQVTDEEKKNLPYLIEKAGYPKGSIEHTIASFIGKKEGWFPGSRSFRNNNPGNLAGKNFTDIDPLVELEKAGLYAKFSNPILGIKALVEKKIKNWSKGNMPVNPSNQKMIVQKRAGKPYEQGKPPTVAQFFYTYAPPSENDTEKYIKDFIYSLGSNIDRNTIMIDLLST